MRGLAVLVLAAATLAATAAPAEAYCIRPNRPVLPGNDASSSDLRNADRDMARYERALEDYAECRTRAQAPQRVPREPDDRRAVEDDIQRYQGLNRDLRNRIADPD